MPREVLYLSLDFAKDEFNMVRDIFLVNQQNHPDPSPRISLLNFHTIALLVLEYLALPSTDPDVDVDEAFLAALDKWRIGKEAHRQTYMLIRGVQEFFDVALDMIYYMKQYGFVAEPVFPRKERSDKGAESGPQGGEVNVLKPRKKAKDDVEVGHKKGAHRAGVKKTKAKGFSHGTKPPAAPAKGRGRPPNTNSIAPKKSRK
jgi:hypothetical protein